MEVGNFPLKDKIVLVTGGGSGICLAFVKRARDLGAKGVIVGDLQLTPSAQEVVESSGNKVAFQKTDVTNWKDLQQLVDASKEKFGATPDVYVAGAGVWEPPWSSFWHDKEEQRYASIDINVSHVIKLTRIALQTLVSEDRKGVVLPVASMAGFVSNYAFPIYIATKHAVVGFVKSMAMAEKYEGVKVVAMCPGVVDTPLWSDTRRDQLDLPRIEALTPDDVAKAMVDLVQEGKYAGGTLMEIVPDNGPKTRVLTGEPADPPRGLASRPSADIPGDEIPKAFQPAKEVMDKTRGTGFK